MITAEPGNELEIRANGLQRSGNHAIINWIAQQTSGKCLVLNDARPGLNPFETMGEYLEYYNGRLTALEYTWNSESRRNIQTRIPRKRNTVIYSYEDKPLHVRDAPRFVTWIGQSQRFFDVLIVRDPMNFFASRLRMFDRLSGIKDMDELVAMWKAYAREAIGLTSNLDPEVKVVVKFNSWFADAKYRKVLASRLGLHFTDRGVDTVVRVGHGSSFDEFAFETQASRMSVNDRWKTFEKNARYRSILADPEMQALSETLFGPHDWWKSITVDRRWISRRNAIISRSRWYKDAIRLLHQLLKIAKRRLSHLMSDRSCKK
jgi:hypothetical protein